MLKEVQRHKIGTSISWSFGAGWQWAWCITIAFVALSIARDIRVKMWIDELFTVFIARQADVVEIVRAIHKGCDGIPPLYSTLVHYLIPIVKNEALAARLPATLGFGAMMLGVFAFCRKHVSIGYALLAMLLTCQVCIYYSTEGRPYGAVLGCGAWVLVFWQRVTGHHGRRSRNLLGLSLCLGFMVAFHYYAICILAPLLFAEIVRTIQRRKLDTGMLAAMTVPVAVVVLHYPLIQAGNPFWEHFWIRAGLWQIRPFYDTFLGPIAMVCAVTVALWALSGKRLGEGRSEITAPEKVLLASVCATPALAIAVSTYTTHVFVDRYVLWAAIGFGIVAAIVLSIALNGNPTVPAVLVAILAGVLLYREMGPFSHPPFLREGEAALGLLKSTPKMPGPILVPDSHVFIELAYYAPDEFRRRLVYPVRRDLDIQYMHSDTAALQFEALGRITNLHAEDWQEFQQRHKKFLMLSVPADYFPGYLSRSGWRIAPAGLVQAPAIWQVSREK